MHATVDRDALADAARWAARHAPAKPYQPVLAGMKLTADTDSLTLAAYDLETAATASFDAGINTPGSAVAPGRLFADIVASLQAGTVTLDTDDHDLHVTTSRDRFTLPLLPTADYPALPVPPVRAGSVAGADLATAVADIAVFAMTSRDAVGANQAMGSVRILPDGDQLHVAATDRYRIGQRTIPWTPAGQPDGYLLAPAALLASAVKALASDTVELAFSGPGNTLALRTDGKTLTTRSTYGNLPPIERHTPNPDAATGRLTVDAPALADAVGRAALVADKTAVRKATLTFTSEQITVTARGDGPASRTSVDADTDALDDLTVTFDANLLASVLTPLDGPAHMWLYTPTKPVLIRPVDKDDPYTAVLMPIRDNA